MWIARKRLRLEDGMALVSQSTVTGRSNFIMCCKAKNTVSEVSRKSVLIDEAKRKRERWRAPSGCAKAWRLINPLD